jgi:PAS domain-containing protein
VSAEIDRQRLVHELQVHQVELEMQNEELLQTNRNLTLLRDEYRDLFDYSPIGYVRVMEGNDEMLMNATLLTLLGLPHDSRGKSFASYIAGNDREVWDDCLTRLRLGQYRDQCRLQLRSERENILYVEVFLTRFITLHGGATLGAIVPIDESAYRSG